MSALHTPAWLKKLAEQFRAAGFEFYLVGGAVRNQLLGIPVREWDATTNALPNQSLNLLEAAGARNIFRVGERFGTVAGSFDNEPLEITTYRNEQYQADSRAPQVQFGQTLRQDLERRDFSVNAIALDPLTCELHDPFGGQTDLRAKLIKSVGPARVRFEEDPLRMLRAVRFMVELDFAISDEVIEAISHERERFGILSVERIAQELNKILVAPKPSRAISLLVETGLISYILPELLPCIDIEFDPSEHKDIYHHILQVLDNTPPKLELRWCALLHDIAKPQTRKKISGQFHFLGHEVVGAKVAKQVLRRLHYPSEIVDYVAHLVRLHQRLPNDDGNWTDGAVRRFVRDAGDGLQDLFAFAEADNTGTNTRKLEGYRIKREQLQERIKKLGEQAEIAKIQSPLDGQELMTLFHRPAGPWIKPVKEHLLGLVLDGKLAESDKEEATKLAKEFIASGRLGKAV